LGAEPITGRLWIVEARRIRVHENTPIEPDGTKSPDAIRRYRGVTQELGHTR
jgi:hypothetical protein